MAAVAAVRIVAVVAPAVCRCRVSTAPAEVVDWSPAKDAMEKQKKAV